MSCFDVLSGRFVTGSLVFEKSRFSAKSRLFDKRSVFFEGHVRALCDVFVVSDIKPGILFMENGLIKRLVFLPVHHHASFFNDLS